MAAGTVTDFGSGAASAGLSCPELQPLNRNNAQAVTRNFIFQIVAPFTPRPRSTTRSQDSSSRDANAGFSSCIIAGLACVCASHFQEDDWQKNDRHRQKSE